MPAKSDITIGTRFTQLVVVAPAGLNDKGQRLYECLCDCGATKIAMCFSLLYGYTKSCGCLYLYGMVTHGLTHSPEYAAWRAMKDRCYNPANSNYFRYGERGISVCEEWSQSFETFYKDMGPKPSPEYSVERVDNNGNYEPNNCVWATPTAQSRNRRNCRYLTLNNRTMTIREWAEEVGPTLGINHRTISYRILHMGMTDEQALTTPSLRPRRRR